MRRKGPIESEYANAPGADLMPKTKSRVEPSEELKNKVEYWLELIEIHRMLRPYVDRDKFLIAKSWRDYPEAFNIGTGSPLLQDTNSLPFGTVRVNWRPLWEVIRSFCLRMISQAGVHRHESKEFIEGLASEQADAILYLVLLFLPEKFDSALAQLLQECTYISTSSHMRTLGIKPPSLTQLAEKILDAERKAIKTRLEVKRGRKSTFLSTREYRRGLSHAKAKLISNGRAITLGGIAEVLGEFLPDASIDERMIRRWNRQFGIHWKQFKKPDKKPLS
jgi:hypothetical protein